MNGQKKTHVLLIYECFTASVRLCGYEQLNYLSKKRVICLQHGPDSRITANQCQWADILVFVRNATWLSYKIAKENQKRGKMILYVIDDDLLAVAPYSASAAYYSERFVRSRVWWFITNSSFLISPSRYILHKYKKYARRIVRMEEPCMITDALWANKDHRKIKIGFAGSADRSSDVQNILQKALEQFCYCHQDEIELEFMGVKFELPEQIHAVWYPFEEDYTNYQRVFSKLNWDIGLAPMPDTKFHHAKHYNKYIEYASIGCVGIYSNVIPYQWIVRHQKNGILCENTLQGWKDALEWCIAHPQLIAENRKRIQSDAQEKFSLEKITGRLLEQIPQLISYRARTDRLCSIRMYRNIGMCIRCIEFLQRYRRKALKKITEKIYEKIQYDKWFQKYCKKNE